jgi:hypothetical protein
MKTLSGSNGQAQVFAWAGAVLLALVTQGGWFFLFSAPDKVTRRLPQSVQVKYHPVQLTEGGEEESEAITRAVWSPVLFSLPTRVGFSEILLEGAELARPPLETGSESAMFLERVAGTARASSAVELGPITNRFQQWRSVEIPNQVQAPIMPRPSGITERGFEAEFVDGLLASDFEVMGWPLQAGGLSNSAWRALAHITTDDRGSVVHVMLEEGTGSAILNEAIVRNLSTWRLKKPGSGRQGKVIVRNMTTGPKQASKTREAN